MAPGPDSEPRWPPRSPREAQLSTPAGRQRYRQALERTSPSPSPLKGRRRLSSGGMPDAQVDEDEDDDEETLQLKLQEIQARLRLKKLQNARNREGGPARKSGDGEVGQDTAGPADGPRQPTRATTTGRDGPLKSAPRTQVQVPASPVRKVQTQLPPTSPSRVLLGIDKGLRAKDVSLKRAPSQRKTREGGASQSRGFLERSRSSTLPATSSFSSPSSTPRVQSFNERLALSRTEAEIRAQRQEKIQQMRTNAFGIGKQEMEDYKNRAVDMPDEPPKKAPTFTRDQILAGGQAPSGNLVRSRTTLGLPSQQRSAGGESSSFSDRSWQDTAATSAEGGEEAASFEPYSCFHLSQRILPHRVLARHVSGMKSLSVKELLKEVKSPDYSLPEVEQDIVVFAIMAKKSEPRAHKASAAAKKGSEAEERGKYMVMTLVDLDFELELFLFNSGFTRFWKVTEGTVVAILNPSVMPPPPGRQDTGRFSLVINSDADTILEIGSARDLGFCQSVKKDGSACGAWVNKKRTQFCEFHSNEAIRKQRSARVEFNSSGFGGWERRPKRGGGSGGGREWQGGGRKGGPDNYDRETKTSWFASRSYSSADLIDGKDRAPADKKERSEFLKRSLEAKEKEREMMKKLGRVGSAAGREYMQRAEQTMMTGGGGHGEGNAGGSATSQAVAAGGNEHRASEVAKPGAISLGLQRGKGRAIHLSPIKRKRPESSQAGSSAGNSNSRHSSRATTGYGWGSSLKDKLSRMKEGQATGQRGGSKSPVRKKTRFVTDKGIREAGRESLGLDLPERQAAAATAGSSHGQADDEDDELIIVK